MIGNTSLFEIADAFYKFGGKLICYDEIHKYFNWAKELKSIYDTFPDLKIIASGSSAIKITKDSNDLSKRSIVYHLAGLSFREYLEMEYEIKFENENLDEILIHHQDMSNKIISDIETNTSKKILQLFKEYLRRGYFPYYKVFNNQNLYFITLEQNIHTTLECDLISIYPKISENTIRKIKKILSVISNSVPY